jgi:hypothetical protein
VARADARPRALILLAPLLAFAVAALYAPVSVAPVACQKLVIGGATRCERPSGRRLRAHLDRQAVARLVPWRLMAGTEFQHVALRALGRASAPVHIHRGVNLSRGGWDLLDIGDDASIAQDAEIQARRSRNSEVVIGPVTIGATVPRSTSGRAWGPRRPRDGVVPRAARRFRPVRASQPAEALGRRAGRPARPRSIRAADFGVEAVIGPVAYGRRCPRTAGAARDARLPFALLTLVAAYRAGSTPTR